MVERKKCANCKAVLPRGAGFCHNCGVDVPEHNRNHDDRKLCSLCLRPFSRMVLTQKGGRMLCPECEDVYETKRGSTAGMPRPAVLAQEPSPRQRLLKECERQDERFDVNNSFLRLKKTPKGIFAQVFHRKEQEIGSVIDLSGKGAQCITRGGFQKGYRVALELVVPVLDGPLCLTGVVVWIKNESSGQQRIGIQFDPPDKKTRVSIRALKNHPDMQ